MMDIEAGSHTYPQPQKKEVTLLPALPNIWHLAQAAAGLMKRFLIFPASETVVLIVASLIHSEDLLLVLKQHI